MGRHSEPYNLNELMCVMSEVIEDLRNNRANPAVANATSTAVGKMLSAARLQMDYQRLRGRANESLPVLEAGDAD